MVRSCKLLPSLANEGARGHKPWELLAGNIIIHPGTLVAFSRTHTVGSWPISYCGIADERVVRVPTGDIQAYLAAEGLWRPLGATATADFIAFITSRRSTHSHLSVVRFTHIYDVRALNIDLTHTQAQHLQPGTDWTLPFPQTTSALARFGVYKLISHDRQLVAARVGAWAKYFRALLAPKGSHVSPRVRVYIT
jgi:hypothetical protein